MSHDTEDLAWYCISCTCTSKGIKSLAYENVQYKTGGSKKESYGNTDIDAKDVLEETEQNCS
jgi:hypothetical protein